MVVVVYLSLTGMIILDVVSKFRSFRKYKESLAKDSKRKFKRKNHFKCTENLIFYNSDFFFFFFMKKATDDIHIQTYFPFYLEYYILMALHMQFAQTAIGIQRRYHRLNLAIRNIFSLSKSNEIRNLNEFLF